MNKDVSINEKLAYEIYFNYLTYLSQGILVSACKNILLDERFTAFRNQDESIIFIEKDNKLYINTYFLSTLTDFISIYIERDKATLISSGTKDTHLIYACMFVYLCLSNQDFMKDFKKKYDN